MRRLRGARKPKELFVKSSVLHEEKDEGDNLDPMAKKHCGF